MERRIEGQPPESTTRHHFCPTAPQNTATAHAVHKSFTPITGVISHGGVVSIGSRWFAPHETSTHLRVAGRNLFCVKFAQNQSATMFLEVIVKTAILEGEGPDFVPPPLLLCMMFSFPLGRGPDPFSPRTAAHDAFRGHGGE